MKVVMMAFVLKLIMNERNIERNVNIVFSFKNREVLFKSMEEMSYKHAQFNEFRNENNINEFNLFLHIIVWEDCHYYVRYESSTKLREVLWLKMFF